LTTLLTKDELPPPLRGYSDRHLRRMAEDGKIPTPRKLGREHVWVADEIQAMIRTLPRVERTEGRSGSFTPETARAAVNKRWAKRKEVA
jgi:predicted DNA-binding transcriptional regulator AlpA